MWLVDLQSQVCTTTAHSGVRQSLLGRRTRKTRDETSTPACCPRPTAWHGMAFLHFRISYSRLGGLVCIQKGQAFLYSVSVGAHPIAMFRLERRLVRRFGLFVHFLISLDTPIHKKVHSLLVLAPTECCQCCPSPAIRLHNLSRLCCSEYWSECSVLFHGSDVFLIASPLKDTSSA